MPEICSFIMYEVELLVNFKGNVMFGSCDLAHDVGNPTFA